MKKLSSIIEYQLPEFVSSEHEIFVAFIQEYYKYLEQSGNALSFLGLYEENTDLDTISDPEFTNSFMREFASTFPKNILIDKSRLLKYIREFYIAKGSENSFRFIFTLLYNSDIEVEYPREFVQSTSNGNYLQENYAYITANNFFKLNITEAENITVSGDSSGETLIVDDASQGFVGNQRVFVLNLSSYTGTLTHGETVTLTVDNQTVKETAYSGINNILVEDGGTNYTIDDEITIETINSDPGILADAKISKMEKGGFTQVTIVNSGAGYSVGDLVYAADQSNDTGFGFVGQVREVDEDSDNEILSIEVVNPGHGYSKPTYAIIKSSTATTEADVTLNGDNIGKIKEITVTNSGFGYNSPDNININIANTDNGSGADLTPVLSTVFNEPARYVDFDDWPSNYNRLTDSYYYQQFSYVITSNVSPDKWKERVKRIAHPAGTIVFGNYKLETTVEVADQDEIQDILVDSGILANLQFIQETIEMSTFFQERRIEKTINPLDVCETFNTLDNLESIKFDDEFDWSIRPFLNYTIGEVSPDPDQCSPGIVYSEGSEIIITP